MIRSKTHPDFPGYIFYSNGEVVSLERRMKPCKITSGGIEYYQYRVRDKDKKLYQFYSTTIKRKFFPWDWIELLEDDEEVKPLKEYPGYFITTRGRVFSLKHYKFLEQHNFNRYYYKVVLGLGVINPQIHTLVGRNFLPEYQEGLLILHRDETLPYPQINFLSNLWVGTQKDNQQDMITKGRGKPGGRTYQCKEVLQQLTKG